MKRLTVLLVAAATAACASGAHAAPLGPLRVAVVRDGIDHTLNGVAADGAGAAWSAVYAGGGQAFVKTDGLRLTRFEPFVGDGYSDVFPLPGGRVLQLGPHRATIVAGDARIQTTEPTPREIFSIEPGPLGAWIWTYDDTGSGLTLIRADATVVHFPRTFQFQIPAGIVASDATGVWIETRRTDGGTELGRIDAAGVHDIARFATGELGPATLDPQGRLLIATSTRGRRYLKRLESDGLHTVIRLPSALRPAGMETDAHGTVWIADFATSRLFRVSRAGRVRAVELGLAVSDHLRAIDVSGGDVWFTTDYAIGRLVTTPRRCVVPDVRGLTVVDARRLLRSADCAPRGATRGAHVVRQSPAPGTIVPLRGRVRLTNGPRRELRTPAACGLPRKAAVVARNEEAMVATNREPGEEAVHVTFSACHRASGRRTTLLHGSSDGLEGSSDLSHIAFSGRYLAYLLTFANHYGDTGLTIRLLDTRSGRMRIKASVGGLAGGGPYYTQLLRLLVRGELVVYLIRDPEFRYIEGGRLAPSFERLAILAPTAQRVLDEAPAGSISDIRIDGPTVRWTRDGQPHEAPLG